MRPIRASAPARARSRTDGCAPSRARHLLRLGSPRIPICFARPAHPGLAPAADAATFSTNFRLGTPVVSPLATTPSRLIRAISVIAHIDHGKTTLSERSLQLTAPDATRDL